MFKRLLNQGITPEMPFALQRSVRYVNSIAIFISPLPLIVTFIYSAVYETHSGVMVMAAVVVISLLSSLYFNRAKLYSLGRIQFIVVSSLSLVVNAYFFGRRSGFELGFFCFPVTILLMSVSLREIALLVLFTLFGYVACRLIYYHQEGIPIDRGFLVHQFLVTVIFATIYFCLLLLKTENDAYQRIIESQNKSLQEQKEEIAVQGENLAAKNEQLLKKYKQLSELSQEKDGLMGIVAHDLRAPLNRAKGLAQLLALGNDVPGDQDILKKIVNVCDDGNKLIKDLLEISSMEYGRNLPSYQKIDLRNFIKEEVIGPMLENSEKKKITILEDLPTNLCLKTDPSMLQRVLQNLLSNAVKFSPHGSQVIFSASLKMGKIQVTISDNGPGISSEDQQKMFKKFQKLSARPTGGESSNGLGLAIVKTLMDNLCGDIKVHSKLGQGTEFVLTFG